MNKIENFYMFNFELISLYYSATAQAPNFGYALTTRRYKALQKPLSPPLDLSCVKHMINAAEPVDVQDLEAFEETFGKEAGLPPKVVFPTYGLAEHTVFVSSGGGEKLRVDKRALEVRGGSTCRRLLRIVHLHISHVFFLVNR